MTAFIAFRLHAVRRMSFMMLGKKEPHWLPVCSNFHFYYRYFVPISLEHIGWKWCYFLICL